MTSEATMEPTEEFFIRNSYFGLQAENVILFEQSSLPCLTFDGKIILETPCKVARAPGKASLTDSLKVRTLLAMVAQSKVISFAWYCGINLIQSNCFQCANELTVVNVVVWLGSN